MNTKLLHIGLGKCGSVLLTHIFDEIEKETKIKFVNLFDFLQKKKTHALENIINLQKDLPENFIISHRTLFSKGWEFNQIFKSFEYNKKNFLKDTTVLIVIRNPYELLNSIYCQSINVMDIIEPQNFFYYEKNDLIRKGGKFNLYNFDYNNLISLYRSYFENVIVIKYEELHNLNFLKKIFNLNDKFLESLNIIKNQIYNKSISQNGIKFILFLNKFIDLNKYQRLIRSNIKPTNNIFYKIKNFLLYQFLLRNFFQNKFDKLVPYKKYYINKNHLPIDIDKLINDYNNIVTYNDIKN